RSRDHMTGRKPRLFRIFLHVTVSRLLRDGGNRPRPVHVIFSEQLLRVLVGPRLVFPREVQVDIRRLVPLKSQEGLKGNVVAVLPHLRAALGTIDRKSTRLNSSHVKTSYAGFG